MSSGTSPSSLERSTTELLVGVVGVRDVVISRLTLGFNSGAGVFDSELLTLGFLFFGLVVTSVVGLVGGVTFTNCVFNCQPVSIDLAEELTLLALASRRDATSGGSSFVSSSLSPPITDPSSELSPSREPLFVRCCCQFDLSPVPPVAAVDFFCFFLAGSCFSVSLVNFFLLALAASLAVTVSMLRRDSPRRGFFLF